MATTENVITLGSLPEDKKGQKNRKRRKMKQSVCVPLGGTVSKQILEDDHENFSSQVQNNKIEHCTENQALEESEMHDSIHEGVLLFKSGPTQVDSILSEDRSIDQDIMNDRPKYMKKLKLKKRKLDIENDITGSCQGVLSSKRSPVNNSNHHRGAEILTSDIAVTAKHKHEMLGISSPVSKNDNKISACITTPVSINSCVKMDTIENNDPLIDPHMMQKHDIGCTKSSNPRQMVLKMKHAVLPQTSEGSSLMDVNVNGRQDENMVAATEGTHVENINFLNGQPRSMSDKDLITLEKSKENEYCAKNAGDICVTGTDQDIQYPRSHSREKRRKKKKSINSHLIEHGDGDRQIAERRSIRDADNTLSAEGIMSIAAESTHVEIVQYSDDKPESRMHTESMEDKKLKDTSLGIDIIKPPQHSKGDEKHQNISKLNENQDVMEELVVKDLHMQSIENNQDSRSPQNLFTAHSEEYFCRIKAVLDIKKNDDCAENVVTSSEVTVSDRTQDPKICKKKKRKRKRKKSKMSIMSQLELDEEGGATDYTTKPSSFNDMTSKQSNEGNSVATGKGISISHNHMDNMSESNHHVKKVNIHKLTESARSCLDQQTLMEDLKNESVSTPDPSELVAWDPNAEKSSKLGNVKVEDFQVIRSLLCMHSGFAGQATFLLKDSSKISTTSEDICGKNLTMVQEDIIDIPCVITTKKAQNASVQNPVATLLEQEKGLQLSSSDSAEDICSIIAVSDTVHESILHPSPERNCIGCPRRKLLILDINGLLADIVASVRSGYKPDIMVSQKAVFRRPFCESFLQFCFERFDVAVWSSRVKKNVDKVLDFLMGGLKNKLVFYWDRSHCTITGFPTVENREKPLVMKELKKLWEEHQSHFACEKEQYNQLNTLLLDDSPYKALRNPADTAIFPLSYQYTEVNDCSLGPGGDLRVYLESLAMAENIPEYVRNHPFGQRPIRDTNLSWKYYKKVLSALPPSDG